MHVEALGQSQPSKDRIIEYVVQSIQAVTNENSGASVERFQSELPHDMIQFIKNNITLFWHIFP
jgi:hypothetical protein